MGKTGLFGIFVLSVSFSLLPRAGAESEDSDLGEGRTALSPIQFGSLSLIPIVGESAATETPFMVLDEGMKAKKVRIKEVSADGEVNELKISNLSDKPLFLMSGEVIIGGKQDRIIGKTMVVPPKTTQRVGVFCVEQGRWNGRKASFESTGALAHKSLRAKASYSDQSAVWQEVKEKNGKRNVDNETDTYRNVVSEKKVKESLKGFESHFGGALKKLNADARSRQVGYAVALNGKVVSLEVFGDAPLFRKLEDKLLKSYYVEALDVGASKDAKAVSREAVQAFKKRSGKAKARRVVEGEGGADAADTYQFDEDGLKGSVVKARAADAKAPAVYEVIVE